MTKDGGPAFATGNPEQGGEAGMSLRDWFAGQALAGLAATEQDKAPDYAYWLADKMLEERANPKTT